MRHSPAPWTFQIRDYQIFPEKRDPDERHVLGIEDANGVEIVTTDSGYYGPEVRDARLIVAAPDLLATCEYALSVLWSVDDVEELRESLQESIKKAKGE